MELRISAKNLNVSERFKEYVQEKSGKVEQFAHRPQELNIKVTRYEHSKSAGAQDQVELTVYEPGHVVRAEARADDKFAAFDMAFGKLLERLRRYADKHKPHRGGGHAHIGAAELSAADFSQLDIKPVDHDVLSPKTSVGVPSDPDFGESPIVIRKKEFEAASMKVEQAVDQMELIGHDFFLFLDSETGKPSVVYRRQGWNYGVITLR
jgi:ribosomal subunit interface protein